MVKNNETPRTVHGRYVHAYGGSSDPEAVGLDVDALREAIDSAMTDDEVPWSERPRASQVAAEYQRLTEAKPESPTKRLDCGCLVDDHQTLVLCDVHAEAKPESPA